VKNERSCAYMCVCVFQKKRQWVWLVSECVFRVKAIWMIDKCIYMWGVSGESVCAYCMCIVEGMGEESGVWREKR
jgi:hypothetical protein